MNPDLNQEQSTWVDQERIRQQFDYGPYPRIPLEKSPKQDYSSLFQHNFVTAHYLRYRQVITPQNKLILDVGCGSGYTTLTLAEANPGAKLVGIDISERSLELACERLKFHGFKDVEFHCLRLEDLPQLGVAFDYINCDEVLYLLPDPAVGLHAMKAVLKPDGLIRTNLHSIYQRAHLFRAQALFNFLGLMDENPEDFAEQIVIETMQSLKDGIRLKAEAWGRPTPEELKPENLKEMLAMNLLFIGDTGYTVPQLFSFLEQADLEFVSMVNWRHWDVSELFQEPDNLPVFWTTSLANATIQEKLHVFELLHPIHRLMDFWCAHPGKAGVPVADWTEKAWQTAIVHLHPQLHIPDAQQALIHSVQSAQPFEISQFIKVTVLAPVFLPAQLAACLLPLWDNPQSIHTLVERYRQVCPVDPITLAPTVEVQAFERVKDFLNRLDAFLYVLIEQA